jgi:hypothetical protein
MSGVGLRAVVAVALLLTWLVPGVRLAVLPEERALAAAAYEQMCLSPRAAVQAAAWRGADPGAVQGLSAGPTLAEAAAPTQRAFDRQWRTEATRVAFAAAAALALLAWRRRFGGVAALLGIAAASLYGWAYEPHADAYRLLLVTQSPALWWHAVSQWSWALQAERLLAPLTMWIAGAGACWLLWRAEGAQPRALSVPRRTPRFRILLSRGRS